MTSASMFGLAESPSVETTPSVNVRVSRRWWCEWEVLLLATLAVLIYGSRLASLAATGEESRWARGAVQMLESGDWIVPRQQGYVFPERPPLGSWSMALIGIVRGEVDLVAVRLPSVLAMALTALVIYGYTRTYWTRLAALAAGLSYLTFGQVLVLGRAGESEAMFTLFVSSSLLIWHVGYTRRWRPVAIWTAGYALAACGALVKGPQAPVYFVAVTAGYLSLRKDWQRLVNWSHLAGIGVFALIVGAWLVPFYRLTDSSTVWAIWTGLAVNRFTTQKLVSHLVSYPAETVVCLLPWSLMFGGLVFRGTRRGLCAQWQNLQFVATALLLTYPTVWLAGGARGRYFMPLYPCVAVVLGVIVEQWGGQDPVLQGRRAWRDFWTWITRGVVVLGVVILLATFCDLSSLAMIRQSAPFAVFFAVVAFGFAGYCVAYRRRFDRWRPQVALVGLACFLGFVYVGAFVNAKLTRMNDLTAVVARLKQRLPDPNHFVSFGPIYHRFAYYYKAPIARLRWPLSDSDVPEDVTYFCVDSVRADYLEAQGLQQSIFEDGRWTLCTPDRLPFAWQEIARIACDPVLNGDPVRSVIIGRRIGRRDELVQEASYLAPANPPAADTGQKSNGAGSGDSKAAGTTSGQAIRP